MKFTDTIEIAMFLGLIGICLVVSFTALRYTINDVSTMEAYHSDTRTLRQRDASNTDYAYLWRPGAYLDAGRLSLSAGAASADRRASIKLLGEEIDTRDMYSLNASEMGSTTPVVYAKISDWFENFISSQEHSHTDNSCPFAEDYPFYQEHIASASGYQIPNPTELKDCRFKFQVVESSKAEDDTPVLEYRLFIFLGSYKEQKVVYRWYECLSEAPWVKLDEGE